jgi:hypothetical protein
MDVAAALAELAELSTQVTRAVVVGAGGVEGALGAEGERAASLGRTGEALLAAASAVPHGSAAEVIRAEVVTPAGGVFVIREADRTIVATTVPEPTSGLVLYDLRAVLRRLSEGAPA